MFYLWILKFYNIVIVVFIIFGYNVGLFFYNRSFVFFFIEFYYKIEVFKICVLFD